MKHVDAHMIPKEEEEKKYDDCPPILDLEDADCFMDEDGNRLDIQVVGSRDVNSCYFKLQDVATAFGIVNLEKMVTSARYGKYQEGEHYRQFRVRNGNSISDEQCMYLTYMG